MPKKISRIALVVPILVLLVTTSYGHYAHAAELTYTQLATLRHPGPAFTQGLVVDDGQLLESSGLYGQSYITAYPLPEQPVTTAAPEPLWKHFLPKNTFAEGMTVFNNNIYLLSWRQGIARVYDRNNLELISTHRYAGQGWGLTHDGEFLIRSDGSAKLYFHHTDTFAISHYITVKDNRQRLTQINELEYAEGFIWANIWHESRLVAIHPNTGQVVHTVNLAPLARREQRDSEAVLNGIAWDKSRNAFWITGKRWQNLYLLKIDIPSPDKPQVTTDSEALKVPQALQAIP